MKSGLIFLLSVIAVAAAHRGSHRGHQHQHHQTPLVVSEEAKVHALFNSFSKQMGTLFVVKESEVEDVLQSPQGMSIPLQDPKDQVTPLMEKLDKKCGQRFEQTLKGDAQGMHGLDLGQKSKNLKKDCEKKFEGKLCATKATIHTTHTDTGTDNEVKARFVMDGESCVPEECTSSKNLAALAEFMRGNAQTMGEEMGNELEILLNVDCSEAKHGGDITVPAPPKSGAARAMVSVVGLLLAPLMAAL